mmetsp:Transcript_29113/g.66840  ORF Transcript_29113/g.66840 Transcript_29113/m.66840 type:complete len:428 (+) Transcript_29113:148-1431(+)
MAGFLGVRGRSAKYVETAVVDVEAPPELSKGQSSGLKSAVQLNALFGAHGRSKRKQREHWQPLRIRIVTPGTAGLNAALDAVSIGSRGTVRELKTHDARIRIPDNIGKWLTDSKNVAIDPDGDPPPRLLYAAKISQRFKDRIITQAPCGVGFACPFPLALIQYLFAYYRLYTACALPKGLLMCDQPLLWHSKQYNLRTYLYVYDNRIEANYPSIRFPWGFLGCGSWNEDNIVVHHFDRGSFGFRQIPCGTPNHCCFIWEPFGEVGGRQRCPCNGPLVDSRCKVNCMQWWCDHWCNTLCCCHYQYPGLEDAAEFATAADVALQAYFDRETLTKESFELKLDAELLVRQLPKRSSYEKHDADDKWAYSRTKSLIAVSIGIFAVAVQVVGITMLAFYLRYYLNRDFYANYATTISAQAASIKQATSTTIS